MNITNSDPAAIRPLLISSKIPVIKLPDEKGELFDLNAFLIEKPVILIFYRGGWCPYCNGYFSELEKVESQLIELGYQIIAVTPDKLENINETRAKWDIKYKILSDGSCLVADAFGIAYLNDKHGCLPVPAVYIINKEGVIVFEYINPDFKQRADPDLILCAARSALRPPKSLLDNLKIKV